MDVDGRPPNGNFDGRSVAHGAMDSGEGSWAGSGHASVHDPARLDALRRLAILDTPADVPFERLTELAIELLDVPIAMVTLVDDDRQFFKCQIGLPEPYASRRETPLSHSFCQHVVVSGEPLIIADAREHPGLRANRAIPDLGVIAYAGFPLTTSDGFTLGTFCAIDRRPRQWTARQLELLRVFAAAAMTAIELHAEREEASRLVSRHRVLTEAMADAIVVIDSESRIVDANVATEAMFGYPRDGLLGHDISIIQPASLQERHRAGVARYLETGKRRVSWRGSTVTGRHRDGHEFPIEIAFGEFEEGGRRRFLGVIRDTSERDRLEAQLRQAQKMEAVGQLAGGIAHDFNNLLTAIGGHTELALDALRSGHPARSDLSEIRAAVSRATDMTGQLLAFSRRQMIEPVVFDPAAAIADLGPLLRRLIGERIALSVDAPVGLGAIRMDPTHLDQLVMNLAVNARDAMPAGGSLTISVTLAAPTEVPGSAEDAPTPDGAAAADGWLVLSIADTGTGIAPSAIDHVFEPFFTTKEAGRGTGLGLATVYGIVRQAGARIDLQSSASGTTFRIYLHRLEPVGDSVPGRVHRRRQIAGSPIVLVVEDEDAVRSLIQRVLERHGCAVVATSTGLEAISSASQLDRVDLLLTDVVLPGEDGPVTAGRIRDRHPDVPILYMSGYPGDHSGEATSLEPGGDFLAKPFTGRDLIDRVSTILRARSGTGPQK